jgi:hypothetical protein
MMLSVKCVIVLAYKKLYSEMNPYPQPLIGNRRRFVRALRVSSFTCGVKVPIPRTQRNHLYTDLNKCHVFISQFGAEVNA